jgi:GT2 family glycosyltransferase
VHYGNYDLTRKCLHSIIKSDLAVRIVVSDNNLTMDENRILQDFPNTVFSDTLKDSDDIIHQPIYWLRNYKNMGYAAAVNIGIIAARQLFQSEYYLILNNDCTIDKHTISALLKAYRSMPYCGIMGAKVLFAESQGIINSVGGYFNKFTTWQKNIGAREKDNGQYSGLLEPDYIYGACMFVSNAFIEKVGLMDDSYLLYYEEHDWCIRSRKCGFKNYTCTDAVIYHQQGASSGKKIKNSSAPDYILQLQYGNLIRFYRKHFVLLLPLAYFRLCFLFIKRIMQGQLKHAFLILKVIFGKRIHTLPIHE